MARFKHGINGPFVGKVGSVIGSSRNGIPYMKGPYKKRTTKISDKEKFNRKKFAATQAWLKPLINYLRVGFKGYSARSEGFVSAKSYLHKHALKIEDDAITIDPSLVLVSFGDLPLPESAACTLIQSDELKFTWHTGKSGTADDKDQVMMLAYEVGQEQAYGTIFGQFRNAGSDVLQLPADLKPGSVLQLYMAFIAADRSRQSNSLYLGEIIV